MLIGFGFPLAVSSLGFDPLAMLALCTVYETTDREEASTTDTNRRHFLDIARKLHAFLVAFLLTPFGIRIPFTRKTP